MVELLSGSFIGSVSFDIDKVPATACSGYAIINSVHSNIISVETVIKST